MFQGLDKQDVGKIDNFISKQLNTNITCFVPVT